MIGPSCLPISVLHYRHSSLLFIGRSCSPHGSLQQVNSMFTLPETLKIFLLVFFRVKLLQLTVIIYSIYYSKKPGRGSHFENLVCHDQPERHKNINANENTSCSFHFCLYVNFFVPHIG